MPKYKHPIFFEKYPHLLDEWDWERNEAMKIDPIKLRCSSNVYAHWICRKRKKDCGCLHTWRAQIAHRAVRGRGCPFCAVKRVCIHDSLWFKRPDLMKVWHPNNTLNPKSVSPNSGLKALWKCKQKVCQFGCELVQEKIIQHQARIFDPKKCCHRRTHCIHVSFGFQNPKLLEEWCWNENQNLDPFALTPCSNKHAVFSCSNPDHPTWKAMIKTRTKGANCPFCAGIRVCPKRSLGKHEATMETWMHDKNRSDGLDPQKLGLFSNKKAWFKCPTHGAYRRVISTHTSTNQRCPKCARLESSYERNMTLVLKDLEESQKRVLVPFKWVLVEFKTNQRSIFRENRRLEADQFVHLKIANNCVLVVIEEDGRQHFEEFASIYNDKQHRQALDTLKNQLCEKHGYPLLRISYSVPLSEYRQHVIAFFNRVATSKEWVFVQVGKEYKE